MAEKVTCIVKGDSSKYSDCRCITQIRTDARTYNTARSLRAREDLAGVDLRRGRRRPGERDPGRTRRAEVRPHAAGRHDGRQSAQGSHLLKAAERTAPIPGRFVTASLRLPREMRHHPAD